MTDSRLASSFVQARLYRVNPGRPLRLIVLHDMEAPEGPNTAENCARFFAGPSAGGSAHYCVDTDSIVQCVKEADQAAHAPGSNTDGIGIELCGYARQTRSEWLDDTSLATMRLAAELVMDISARTGIPPVWLTDAQVADGVSKGITTHAAVSRVFRRSDHSDPGPDFPVDHFESLLAPPPPPVPEDDDMAQPAQYIKRTSDGVPWLIYTYAAKRKNLATVDGVTGQKRIDQLKYVGVPDEGQTDGNADWMILDLYEEMQ